MGARLVFPFADPIVSHVEEDCIFLWGMVFCKGMESYLVRPPTIATHLCPTWLLVPLRLSTPGKQLHVFFWRRVKFGVLGFREKLQDFHWFY